MKKLGEVLIWDLDSISTTNAELSALGFDRYLPRSSPDITMTKALVQFKKESDDKLIYKRFDTDSTNKIAIWNERVTEDDMNLEKEITVEFNKSTGIITPSLKDVTHPTYLRLVELYRENSGTINTDQLRKIILKIVKTEAHGTSFTRKGGSYYVDERFLGNLGNVERLFESFPGKLHRLGVYEDQGSVDAIKSSFSADFTGDIMDLVSTLNKEFAAGTITERKLATRKETAEAILGKMNIHKDNLRDGYLAIKKEIEKVQQALEDVTSKVESGITDSKSFMEMLEKL